MQSHKRGGFGMLNLGVNFEGTGDMDITADNSTTLAVTE
jgi:hypothetical protein